MILPSKHLKPDRALLGIGSEILATIEEGDTVSELWERVQKKRGEHANLLSFDWFVLSLSFLYAIDAVGHDRSLLTMRGER